MNQGIALASTNGLKKEFDLHHYDVAYDALFCHDVKGSCRRKETLDV